MRHVITINFKMEILFRSCQIALMAIHDISNQIVFFMNINCVITNSFFNRIHFYWKPSMRPQQLFTLSHLKCHISQIHERDAQ